MTFKKFKDRKISLKLGLFLFAVVLIAVINYIGVIYFANIQRNDAAVVDAAGRNRMLSQRIAFFAGRVARGQPVKEEMRSAITLLNTSLDALKQGGVAPGIGNDRVLPPTPPHIIPVLMPAEELWKKYKKEAEVILDNPALVEQAGRADTTAGRAPLPMMVPNPEVAGSLLFIEQNAAPLLVKLNDLVKMYVAEADAKQRGLRIFLPVLLVLSIAIVWRGNYLVSRYISRPVLLINEALGNLALGNLNYKVDYNSEDEVGKAIRNMKTMAINLDRAADFAENIGRGSFDSDYKPAGAHDKLGQALVTMRDKLLDVGKEDKRRNWATEGMARFADILRQDNHDINKLGDTILSNLVNYMGANQGSIFIVNDDSPYDVHLQLLALYAWNKKKYAQKRIGEGEGLAGQAWLEKEIIYIKKVPEDFVEITSGLGQANPRSIMVVPLKLNGEVFGILELASFRAYEPFEQAFVAKLAEMIAATISAVKINDRTKKLLEQSQRQAEELRAQEEEMRQNMEELQATQEEVSRKEKEYVAKISFLEKELLKLNGAGVA